MNEAVNANAPTLEIGDLAFNLGAREGAANTDAVIEDGCATKIRFYNLDAVRGLAALGVLWFHYSVIFPDVYPAAKVINIAFPYGEFGVHLFFMVSGFVILKSLVERRGKGFVQSRFIRLYPLYWASIILTFLVIQFAPFRYEVSASTLAINFTMLQSFLYVQAVDGVYWSLAYELGFYVSLYALFRLKLDRFIGWMPAIFSVSSIAYAYISPYIPYAPSLLLMVHEYSHLFAGGLALYLLRCGGGSRFQWLVVAAVPLIQWVHDDMLGLMVGIVIVSIMIWAVFGKQQANRWISPLLWVGSISYALYLTHQLVGYVVMARLQMAGVGAWASFIIMLGLALLIAHLLTTKVETPVARWLNARLRPKIQSTRPDS